MLRFTEGFDWTTTIGNFVTQLKWTASSGLATGNIAGTLRFGSGSGNYLSCTNSNHYIEKAFGSNEASGVIGFAFRNDTAGQTCNMLVLFDDTTVQIFLRLNTDNTVSICRATTSTVLGTTTETLTTGTWKYVELKWAINNSIGGSDVILYFDGVAVLTLSAAADTQNTANAYATKFRLLGPSPNTATNNTTFIDDVYWLDLTGSVNNAPLGDARIQTLYPNDNGNTSNFTGSDGNSVNNYQQVDETALNTADYNDGAAVNDKDTYAFTDTLSTTTVIHGLSINHISLRTDADARSVCPVVRHSGTDYDGSNQSLGATSVNYQQIYETNPGTSSGWTKSDVDAAEFGLKVTV
jgi:hypothetical protein